MKELAPSSFVRQLLGSYKHVLDTRKVNILEDMKRVQEREKRIEQFQYTKLKKLYQYTIYFMIGCILLGVFGQSMAVGFVRYQITKGNWGSFNDKQNHEEVIITEKTEEKVTAQKIFNSTIEEEEEFDENSDGFND